VDTGLPMGAQLFICQSSGKTSLDFTMTCRSESVERFLVDIRREVTTGYRGQAPQPVGDTKRFDPMTEPYQQSRERDENRTSRTQNDRRVYRQLPA
jgi:hypothetical protein